jgi:hypothetical protein
MALPVAQLSMEESLGKVMQDASHLLILSISARKSSFLAFLGEVVNLDR